MKSITERRFCEGNNIEESLKIKIPDVLDRARISDLRSILAVIISNSAVHYYLLPET